MDKYHKRMIQDQNTQTSHPNNNISEGLGEQQLDTITGGCLHCGGVSTYAKKGAHEAYRIDNDHGAILSSQFRTLKNKAFGSISETLNECPKYQTHRKNLATLDNNLKNLGKNPRGSIHLPPISG